MIAREYRELPLELVDGPDAPSRLAFDPHRMEELMDSIREKGQLQPGGVVPNGERFTVCYGDRRFQACKALGLDTYAAYVYESDSAAMLGAQLDENIVRHDLNPVEEAYWFAQLLDAMGGDTDELALLLKRDRNYVESRLLLLKGDPAVLEALGANKIVLGVAQILNAYDHAEDRRVLLDAAMAGGASIRLVRQWVHERKQLHLAQAGAPPPEPGSEPAPASVYTAPRLACLFCDSDQEVYLMVPVYVHKVCLDHLQRILARHMGGHAHAEAPQTVSR